LSVAFSPDGKTLASASRDQTIRLWDISPWHDLQVALPRACRAAGRNFTWEEWRRYLGDRPYELTCPDLPVHPSFIESGRELARAGNIDAAVARFEEALELDPDLDIDPQKLADETAAEALVEAGEELARGGDIEGAIGQFEEALELDPDLEIDPEERADEMAAEGLLAEGRQLARDEEYEAAIEAYTEAIDLDPDNAEVYATRGIAHRNLNDYEQAIADYDRAIELDPDNAITYGNRGLAYYYQQNYEQAIADYTRALELDPDYQWAYYNRGLAYYYQGKTAQAIADYDRAIELDPDYQWAYSRRAQAHFWGGNNEAALADARRAAELEADEGYFQSQLCLYGGLLGTVEPGGDILAACEQAVALSPDDEGLAGRRGIARARAGDVAGAAEDFAVYLQWLEENRAYETAFIEQYRAWLTELQAGNNPLDEAARDTLREWYRS
jgi:tetratricopeptide (TPR) repeat protein